VDHKLATTGKLTDSTDKQPSRAYRSGDATGCSKTSDFIQNNTKGDFLVKDQVLAVTAGVAGNQGKAKHTRRLLVFFAAMFGLALAAVSSAQAQTFKALHQFNSQNDGAEPQGAILRDAAGNLYGTTAFPGTVFKINPKGKESILAAMDSPAPGLNSPTGTLIQDQAGNLYGVAGGGPGGAGVVYKVSLKGKTTILFAFQGGLHTDTPKGPAGGLFMDKSGNIFGAAQFGSDQSCQIGCGSIFQLDPNGNLNLLYKFTGGSDGGNPIGPLVQDADGNFYGVAQSGGDLSCPEHFLTRKAGCGVVFKLAASGELTVLHTFTGGKDGAVPQGGLLLDPSGSLFGTTFNGGKTEHGTVFKIAQDGAYTVLHRFTDKEGKNPNGGLVEDPAGKLYGTAQLGGAHSLGSVFQLSQDGRVKVLHSFKGLEDGASPFAGLFRDDAGHLYGTTVKNFLIQIVQGGNVFEITP
jgi:uncharacterized repeat protein (TIGR03803 family)